MIALYHQFPEMREFTEEVISCEAAENGCFKVILNNTAFYPTGGGQPCDFGTLDGFPVLDVSEEYEGAPIVHLVKTDKPLSGKVKGVIDWNRRLDHMQQHSGQHLLSHCLYERFQSYSLGLHIGAEDGYVDLVNDGSFTMTRDLADEMEREVTAWIARNEPVKCFFPTDEELEQLPLRKKKDEHKNLRVVCIGKDEAVACCGTHVATTGQVQMVHILSWNQSHGNLRIFFVAGQRAVNYAMARIRQADSVAKLFSCGISDVLPMVEKTKNQIAELTHEVASAKKELAMGKLSQIAPISTEKGSLYVALLPDADDKALKDGIAVMTKRTPNSVCLLAARAGEQFLLSMGLGKDCPCNAGTLLKNLLATFGGKGGGRQDSAFGKAERFDCEEAKEILVSLLNA